MEYFDNAWCKCKCRTGRDDVEYKNTRMTTLADFGVGWGGGGGGGGGGTFVVFFF